MRPDEEELVDYDEAYEESFVPSVNGPGQPQPHRDDTRMDVDEDVSQPSAGEGGKGIGEGDGKPGAANIGGKEGNNSQLVSTNVEGSGGDKSEQTVLQSGAELPARKGVEQEETGSPKNGADGAGGDEDGDRGSGPIMGQKKLSVEEAREKKEEAMRMMAEAKQVLDAAEAEAKEEAAKLLEDWREEVRARWMDDPVPVQGPWGEVEGRCQFCWRTELPCNCETGCKVWLYQNGLRFHNNLWYRRGVPLGICMPYGVLGNWLRQEAMEMYGGKPRAIEYLFKDCPIKEAISYAYDGLERAFSRHYQTQLRDSLEVAGYDIHPVSGPVEIQGWQAWPNPPGFADERYEASQKKAKEKWQKAKIRKRAKGVFAPNVGAGGRVQVGVGGAPQAGTTSQPVIPTGPSAQRGNHQQPPHLNKRPRVDGQDPSGQFPGGNEQGGQYPSGQFPGGNEQGGQYHGGQFLGGNQQAGQALGGQSEGLAFVRGSDGAAYPTNTRMGNNLAGFPGGRGHHQSGSM